MGVTFIAQSHGWRGFNAERDLLDCKFTLGFVTFVLSRRPLLDRLWAMLSAAKEMSK